MAAKLKYALIGCGGCGTNKHLASYARFSDDIDLYAVYDFDAEKAEAAAKKFGVTHIFDTYEALLEDQKVDIVSIATPNSLHAPIAIAALQAGKHVHVEKPIAVNAIEAQTIAQAQQTSGKKLMVALNNRFTDVAQYAKRYIDEGHLGEIYHAKCGWRRRRGIPGRGGWFTTKALSGGGPLIDLGVHFFDLTLYLMGFPAPLAVSASTYCKFANTPAEGKALPEGTFDVEDFSSGFVKLEGGASVAFEFSWASNIERDYNFFELLGDKGGMSMYDGELKIFSVAAGSPINVTPVIEDTGAWGEKETRHFIDCIKHDTEPLATAEEAVKMMTIIDAIYASSAAGREIAMPPLAV